MGKELLTRSHYASNEIKEKLKELTGLRNTMLHRWEERWEHLQLILEVYQFARDAAVAEAWLIAQDPYLKSEELGVSFKLGCQNVLSNKKKIFNHVSVPISAIDSSHTHCWADFVLELKIRQQAVWPFRKKSSKIIRNKN